MPTYIVTIEDRIICAGKIRVHADNAAEAALLARREAMDGNITMTPMENGEENPHVYRIRNEHGDDIATLGDGIGGDSNRDCLANHLAELLAVEGIDEYEFDEDLLDD